MNSQSKKLLKFKVLVANDKSHKFFLKFRMETKKHVSPSLK